MSCNVNAEENRITISVPRKDYDVVLEFPLGHRVVIQLRPSNADVNYAGSLDIIFPDNQWVANWEGDDMRAAKACPEDPCNHFAKQLVTALPPYYASESDSDTDASESDFAADNAKKVELAEQWQRASTQNAAIRFVDFLLSQRVDSEMRELALKASILSQLESIKTLEAVLQRVLVRNPSNLEIDVKDA